MEIKQQSAPPEVWDVAVRYGPYLKCKECHSHDGYSLKEYVFKEESTE